MALRLVHHDLQELVFTDLAILIEIKLINHSLTGVSVYTYSSSSSRFSPSSLATRFRFRRLILPVLSSSNRANARRISSLGSRAEMRSVTARQHAPRTNTVERRPFHETCARSVIVTQNLENLSLFKVKAEGAHSHLELMVVHGPILVSVEKVKGFADLLALILGQFHNGHIRTGRRIAGPRYHL